MLIAENHKRDFPARQALLVTHVLVGCQQDVEAFRLGGRDWFAINQPVPSAINCFNHGVTAKSRPKWRRRAVIEEYEHRPRGRAAGRAEKIPTSYPIELRSTSYGLVSCIAFPLNGANTEGPIPCNDPIVGPQSHPSAEIGVDMFRVNMFLRQEGIRVLSRPWKSHCGRRSSFVDSVGALSSWSFFRPDSILFSENGNLKSPQLLDPIGHLNLDSNSLKSYHAIGRKRQAVDYIALILTNELILGGSYGKDYRN